MNREQLLTRMIHIYGFEHQIVKDFAVLLTRPQFNDAMLEAIVKAHEEYPLIESEEEDD